MHLHIFTYFIHLFTTASILPIRKCLTNTFLRKTLHQLTFCLGDLEPSNKIDQSCQSKSDWKISSSTLGQNVRLPRTLRIISPEEQNCGCKHEVSHSGAQQFWRNRRYFAFPACATKQKMFLVHKVCNVHAHVHCTSAGKAPHSLLFTVCETQSCLEMQNRESFENICQQLGLSSQKV